MMLPRRFGRFRPDGNFWTVPNALSMGRVLLVVPVAWLIMVDGSLGWIFALLAVMIMSDWLDGRIARRAGRVSDWGKILDPLADKIAGIAIVLALALRGMLPVWFLMVLITRDLLILLGSGVLVRRTGRMEMSDWSGKVAVGAVAVTVLAALMRADDPVMRFCLFATTGLLAGSFAMYGVRYARLMKQSGPPAEAAPGAASGAIREEP
ncbi:MAG: CDP-alcohol phosphatidyltransferase family protein [Bacteroidetes bacterium SB0662_bin_6]|nr:CDP-alcohol phosphatidyltransferase family protein [Bacteroidetes bacterium SB0668_bin_1]MYE04213.1 CDP-alcohol phosphatidyltransferase family protein [Bacteroidetes bacterium SB0662_bin_6]